MTQEHFKICQSLGTVNCLPGTWDKRFINAVKFLNAEQDLTEKQQEWIFRLVYKYRKQIPNTYSFNQNNPLCSKL